MSVKLLLGRPGSGKSYESVVHYVLPALKKKRTVVTNLSLNLSALAAYDPSYPDYVVLVHDQPTRAAFSSLDDYTQYTDKRNVDTLEGVLFVIDEAHKSVPSGNQNTSQAVIKWFAEHRHSGSDVVLITQDSRKLHRHILSLVDDVIVCTKNRVFGSTSSYRRRIKDGIGGDYLGDAVVRKYNKKFFAFYQSYTQGGKKEVDISRVPTVFSNPIFIVMALVLCVAGYLLYNKGSITKSLIDKPRSAVSSDVVPAGFANPRLTKQGSPVAPPRPVPNGVQQPVYTPPVEPIIDVVHARIGMQMVASEGSVTYVLIRDRKGDVTRHTDEGLIALGFEKKKLSDGSLSFISKTGSFVAYHGSFPSLPYDEQMRRDTYALRQLRSGVPQGGLQGAMGRQGMLDDTTKSQLPSKSAKNELVTVK